MSHPGSSLGAPATAPAMGPTVRMEANAQRNTMGTPAIAPTQPMMDRFATKVSQNQFPEPFLHIFEAQIIH